ncbi:MAG: hypothetical protein MUD08_00435 [Cytophagales bacterium]|jgi:hypothetical protein|nr:hypothetical protein [Cytophagales bacterium]
MAKVDKKQCQSLLHGLHKMRKALLNHEHLFGERKSDQLASLLQLEQQLMYFQQDCADKETALRHAQENLAAGLRLIRLQLLQQAHLMRKSLGKAAVVSHASGFTQDDCPASRMPKQTGRRPED